MEGEICKGHQKLDGDPIWKNYLWVAVILLIVSFAITGYAWARKDVQLIVGEESRTVTTFAQSVGELLVDEGVTFEAHDQIEPSLETPLKKGMEIIVNRAFVVTIAVEEQILEVVTLPVTVREVLHKAMVNLGPEDRISLGLEEQVTSGTELVITRVATEELIVKEEIPYKVVRHQEPNLDRGQTKVVQKGQKGLVENIYRITYEDGQEISKELVSKKTVKAPVSEEVLTGSRQTVSRGGNDFRFRESKTVEATAYAATGNRTYTGTWPQRGSIAVDPRVISLGTKMYVEGYGAGTAEDIGGAIKGNRIDVFVDSEQEAVQWGRRKVKVYILE